MKKIVVVVKGEKIVFQGDDLEAIDAGVDTSTSKILVVRKTQGNKEHIAVFKHWDYWREIRENDETRKSKILIRNKKPMPAVMIRNFLNNIKSNDLIVIPNDLQVIIIDGLGEAKIL